MSSTKVEYHAELNENNVTLATNKGTNKEDGQQTSALETQPGKQGRLPRLFERSSKKWWNPQMDSEILEKQCLNFVLEQSRWYFQLALLFIMVACISWMIYFGATRQASWIAGLVWAAVLALICIATYIITQKTPLYKRFSSYIAVTIAALLIVTVILAAFYSVMTSVGSFFLAAETILLLYTVMPLPLHINFALGIVFSIAYEILYHAGSSGSVEAGDIIAHILLHLCLHVIGVQICLNLQVRRRSTFWKVGQIINSNQSVEMERGFKKVMIDSIMPKSVSDVLMRDGQNIFRATSRDKFRPLYVERMEDVSILYADIVGFTKMSSGKTAAELVYLLNDLFGRFDALCLRTGCEKISTLGDCYYCVAGCPVPKPDHAKRCVEMGLGMIKAIKDFCADNQLSVDMRIGIHTGIVICGVVGMKRFKFDVWSNDVSFANLMEQWGVPGRIHISEPTRQCLARLGDEYEIEDGKIEERAPKDVVESRKLKTYLIVKSLKENSDTSSMSGESSISSQEPSNGENGKTPDKISVENEKPKTNGLKSDGKEEGEVGDAHENPVAANSINGTLDHETSQPNDPLLSVKQRPSHRHHHSSRGRSRKQHENETKKNQDIFEFIGMLPFLDTAVREKQDKEFVNTIKDDPRMQNINNDSALEPVSMRFKDHVIEEAYRNKYETEVKNHEPITSFVSARFSFFLDLLISFIVFVLVFFASVAILPIQFNNVAWIVFFCIFFCLILFAISVSGTYVFNLENTPNWIKTLILDFSGWVARHFIGAILLVCPAGVVFSNLWCHVDAPTCAKHLILIGVVIVHFLNFNQLSSWIRYITACFVALTIILLVYVNPCSNDVTVTITNNVTQSNETMSICDPNVVGPYEFVLDILLLMLFIFIVNREYEVGHRLTFYSAREAGENKNKMEEEKEQIDQLLFHIIPPRVTEVIREKKMYSQNHENVAVIFASITNFNEFYEEQYAGGKECIRILNELIGDVDERLDQEKYAIVEKIKTIGSTFMIASGLNPTNEADIVNHSHLVTLMEFCMEMQDVIHEFSENMVYFKFILRIGFNHGSVTAGVIGTTKLLYDIWGDTVNIASRMDSTGLPGRIQVAEGSMECLKDKFEFEHRGSTYVKGKGKMETFLVKRPGDEDKFEDTRKVGDYVEY